VKDVMLPFRPEMASPAAVFLAHESCSLNGEILVAGGGQVQRLVFSETQGIIREAITPEDIAQNLDAVMDVSNAQVLGVTLDAPLQ